MAVPEGAQGLMESISPEGVVTQDILAVSPDGLVVVEVPQGTEALTAEGQPLEYIGVVEVEEPPAPPSNMPIIGMAYDFGPDGATFDPPVTITVEYDVALLPEGVAEEDLVIAYFDVETGEWIELAGVVDPIAHTVTAQVSHFTRFAVLGPVAAPAAFALSNLGVAPAEVEEGDTVTVTVDVVNTGELEGGYTVTLLVNGAAEAAREITLAGGATTSVTFSLAKDAGSYQVEVGGLMGSFQVTAAPTPTPTPTPMPGATPTYTTIPTPTATPTPVPTPILLVAPPPTAPPPTAPAVSLPTPAPAGGLGGWWALIAVAIVVLIGGGGAFYTLRRRRVR
jgi:hypothetical protein